MLRRTLMVIGALCLSCCVNGWTLRPRWFSEESRQDVVSEWKLRQRFLLDLLLQVHKPLLQRELIEMGRQLNEDPSYYETGTWPMLLDFMDDVHQGRILRPYGIYSQLQEELPQQLLGVYRFLLLAKDWKSFQSNACYARIRFNPVLFVNALQLAIRDRMDTRDLVLPALHEVLPQLYFDKEIILQAQRVNWQQLAPIPTINRSWKGLIGSILFPKSYSQTIVDVELIPADPMVIEVKPLARQLCLDVELNGYWNRLINRLTVADQSSATRIMDGDRLMALPEEPFEDKDQVLLLHNIRQFVALFQLEELVMGPSSLQLIEPTLLTTGGVPYKATGLSAEAVHQLISESIAELRKQIDKELTKVNKMQAMWTVGQVIATQYWRICRHLSQVINGNRVEPNLLGMATSNLRDPIYRLLLFQLSQLMLKYEHRFKVSSHHKQQLQWRQIRVGQLVTYDELVDTDLINLMDQQLLQSQHNNLQLLRRRLVARQNRLNHKSFNITYELFAAAPTAVVFRSYLLPVGQNQPRLLFDSFISHLAAGENQLERQFPMASIGHTLSDLYEAKESFNVDSSWSFPNHLLLPRGTAEGLKLQLLVEISLGHSTQDWPAHNVASALLDVVIYHHEYNIL